MTKPAHISLIAIPDASISTLHGLYDVLSAFPMLKGMDQSIPDRPPFRVEIVGPAPGPVRLASGLSVQTHRSIGEITATDIIIVPSVLLTTKGWQGNRYPELVAWLRAAHDRGARLCSACSGVFLIAETGLLDGRDTTLHWSYAPDFRSLYPQVPISPEKPWWSPASVGSSCPRVPRCHGTILRCI